MRLAKTQKIGRIDMNKTLRITIILGLLPAVIFASEKQINCDDLALHIKSEVAQAEYSGSGRSFGVYYCRNELRSSYFVNDSAEVRYKDFGCKEAGRYGKLDAITILPDRITLFQKYQNALKRCVEASETPSSLASQTIQDLQKKMDMSSQCIVLCNEGVAEVLKEKQEKTAKREALETYIRDSNKK
jgi:hypothetical protein